MDEPDTYSDVDPQPVDTAEDPCATDTTTTEPVVLDLDENGVPDALVVELAPGLPGIIVDVDENGTPDVVLVDIDGDGVHETWFSPDGAGGFVLSTDADGDGEPEQQQPLTRDELEGLVPGLAEVLDPQVTSDPSVEQVPAGDDGWSVQDGQLIGDPAAASEHWFQQSVNGFCAPASIAQIVSAYTGVDYPDEQAFVEVANEVGAWGVGPDGVPGMTMDGALRVLEASGVPATQVQGDMGMLTDYLVAGHGVMVFVDSGEVWAEDVTEDDAADHMVVVTGIDVERGVVILSDPGTPDGDMEEVPIEVFADAWADSDNAMIVADDPAPTTDSATDSATAAGTLAASQMATVTAGVVGQPWVLLPVSLPAGAPA